MASLDALTEDIAQRFDLGLDAPALVQDVLGLVSAQFGSISGFLDKVKAAGLEEKAASWLVSPYPMALSVPEVKQVADTGIIKTIAENTGVTEDLVPKILAYVIPKIVSHLAADGALSEAIPAHSVSSLFGEEFKFGSERQIPMHNIQGGGIAATDLHLAVPGAALLITLGLLGYSISSGTSGDRAHIQSAPSLSLAQNTLVMPSPRTSSQPSQATPGNETNGANTSTTPGPRKPMLGLGKMTGDFAVKAGWIQNLKAAFGGYGGQVSQPLFAGNEFYEETTKANGNRTWRIGSVWPAQVPQFVVAALTGTGAAHLNSKSAAFSYGFGGKSGPRVRVAKNIPSTPAPQTPSQPSQPTPITGDFAVTSGWIQNLSAAIGGFGAKASQTPFEGNGFYEETTIADANRAWRIGSLWPAQVPQIIVAALTGGGEVPLSLASAISELASSGDVPAGLPANVALDFPIIIFAPNSAMVPSRSIPLLRRVAEQIKQLPDGTVVQIDGYTQGRPRPALNAELSQRRADSVYRILVREGVSRAMLSAKGQGSAPSVASLNGVTEGRSSRMMGNGRRVEFRVIQQSP